MMVRFATLCDAPACSNRSAEYVAWPSCRECLLDTCPEHTIPGTLIEDEGHETVICLDCREHSDSIAV